jgi:hypothetical protein
MVGERMKKTKKRAKRAPSWHKWLREQDACKPAREFCRGKTLQEAWTQCENYGWMEWLLWRLAGIQLSLPFCSPDEVRKVMRAAPRMIDSGYDVWRRR